MLVEPWRVTLFGGLEAEQSSRKITRFRTRKAASLFAFLACFPQRSHSREEITERFWPDDDPDTGRAKLRLALTSLRHQLEPPGTQAGTVLFADRTHLRLNTPAVETDVAAFEAHLDAAQRGDTEAQSAADLMQAIERYGGDLLPGDYEGWALQERERLKSRYLDALSRLVRLLCGLNRAEEALEYARPLVAADPLHEDAHVFLMRLYLQLNRPVDAARQYQELQQTLRQAFDAVPGEAAQVLAAVLPPLPKTISAPSSSRRGKNADSPAIKTPRRSPALQEKRGKSAEAASSSSGASTPKAAPSIAVSVPPADGANVTAARLPVFLTRCFGRDKDVRLLAEMLRPDSFTELDYTNAFSLRDHRLDSAPIRLVTLTGPGGAGKTRLAVETARYLQQQTSLLTAFVPLADVTETAHIPRAIADTLRLPRAANANEVAQIVDTLQNTPALLVLDNFEQLPSAGADVIQKLLARLPALRCLVTSRHHLGLPGERTFPVQPLPGAFSQQLFVDRAQSVRADFQLTPRNAQAIAELCDRLEGIPLAIELAAVWIGVLSPAQMLSRLNRRFDLLIDRRDDRAPRHRALRAAIAWSFDLLPPDLQAFFTCLSVFRGGWTEEAAQTVCEQPGALHLLAQLRERSLVVSEETEDGAEMRFRLLESMREFAAETLPADKYEPLYSAHAAYFLHLAETADTEFNGPQQAFWFTRLEQEHNNVRAALAWYASREEDGERELWLASAMQVFWWTRGYIREGRERLNAALSRPGMEAYPKAQRKALAAAGILANMQGDYVIGREYHERALELARQTNYLPGVAIALGSLGNIARNTGDYPHAEQLYTECLEIARSLGQKSVCATAIGNLGNVAKETGNYTKAQELYEEGLGLHREIGNKQGMAIALSNLAALSGENGDTQAALPIAAECLELCRELGDKEGIAFALEIFAQIAARQGQWSRAARLYAAASGLRERLGTPLSLLEAEVQQQNLIHIREQHGTADLEAIWRAETADTLETSLAFALEAVPQAAQIYDKIA